MTVRVGVCSAAHVHTDAYLRLLSDLDDAELVGIADDDPKRGREAADRHGTESTDSSDLLARVDAAVVCATNADHREWVRRAADAGVDVLCEKPLAPSLDEASEIVSLADEAGIHLGVAMPLRFSDPVQRAAERLGDDAVGDLFALSGTNRGRMPGGWFADPEKAGGGAVMDHTVHVLDLVLHLTGRRVTEVFAEVDTRFHDIAVDDVNVLSMELDDGTPFVLDGSWSRPDEWHTWGDATLELVGESGTLAIDCFDQRLLHTRNSGEAAGVNSVFWGTDPNEGLLRDFLAAVEANRPPAITGADGQYAVAVVEAAYRAAASGEPEPVDF
ncbi:Gfo/Idh/MocA family protein [Haloarchaeobius sp. DFWS5]|uniref:Gfo/Idh/MocA family protein n=1 Tax=Haloarchaeobius sp. DFWS5 TaxID=3446114 RepID=UPI003EC04CD9